MATRIQDLEAELRGVQIVLGTMLAHAFITSPDIQKQVDAFREEIDMSCTSASLSEIPEKQREAYRKRMHTTALATIAMAATVQMYPRTKGQH